LPVPLMAEVGKGRTVLEEVEVRRGEGWFLVTRYSAIWR
jgi:hypothetical protein